MSNIAAQELQSFVRRVENVETEINALNADKSAIYKEAKSGGFNVKILRKVIAARRMDATERSDQDAEFDLYWGAIHGVEYRVVRAHVEIIEEFDAETGEITEPQEPSAPTLPVQTEGDQRASLGTSPVESEAVAISTNVSPIRPIKQLRPLCQNRERCGASGPKECWKCLKAVDQAGAA